MSKNPLEERMKVLNKQRKTGDLYSGVAPETKKRNKEKRKKKKKVSNEVLYTTILGQFQNHIYELICQINDIPLDYYLTVMSDGSCDLYSTFKIDDRFKKLSKLKWSEPCPIDGLYFRGRFATVLLMKVVRRSHKVIKAICKDSSGGFKYKNGIEVIQGWMKIVDTFVATYLSSNADYQPFLIKMESLFMLHDEIDSGKLFTHILETEKMMERNIEPGLVANNVTKIAFVLATHGTRTKKCPDYDEYYQYSDNHLVANQIGGLGYAIIRYRQKNPKEKLPPLYAAFQEANPEILSRFGGKTDEMPEMVVGLKALEFSKIFYSDKTRADDLIGKLM